jgi:hypothetical protein
MPLSFEANAGQTDERVKFLSHGAGYTLFLTGDEAVLALKKSEGRTSKFENGNSEFENRNSKIENAAGIPRPLIPNLEVPVRVSDRGRPNPAASASAVLRMKLVGANPAAKVTGAEELPGKANYFIGNDPKKWRSNVPTYSKVRYQNVYPGVDLLYYGNQGGQLEYDFVVAPGADPSAIALDVGAGLLPAQGRPNGSPLHIADGDLVIPAQDGELRFHKPVVYQDESTVDSSQFRTKIENRQSAIANRQFREGRFTLDAQNRVHFALGPYDHTRPLVIDPVLVYSTYLGGSNEDYGTGIAVDSSGNAYVIGYTASTNFPTENAYQATFVGVTDAFVAELNWDASSSTLSLVYSTYLGGGGLNDTWGYGIAVDSTGNAYVTGQTESNKFPTLNPISQAVLENGNPATYSGAFISGGDNAFVAKLNSTGSALVYSTFLGGNASDSGTGIAVDSSGNAYVTGYTQSTTFPTANAISQTVSENGSPTHYSGASLSGGTNAFVAKLNWSASTSTLSLVYSTYLGEISYESGTGIAVDSPGNAYVTGQTQSTNFPTVNAFQPSLAGPDANNAFVAKLNWAASTSTLSLVYSTYLGGSNYDIGQGIAVDSSGNAYVTGQTQSTNFPTLNPISQMVLENGVPANYSGASLTTPGPPAYSDLSDAFVAKLNSTGSALVYSTYLGASACCDFGQAAGQAIAVDSSGNAYVTGWTESPNFPTVNAFQGSLPGVLNAFVAELNWVPSTTTLSLVYSTYLGGSNVDYGYGIAVDSAGNAYVTGNTRSTNFPTENSLSQAVMENGVPTTYSGAGLRGYANAFVAKISGAGAPGVTFSPTSLTFPSESIGTTSISQSVKLTSSGTGPLTIDSIGISGDFALITTATSCTYSGETLPSAATCTIDVTFTPAEAGTRTGAVTVADNAAGTPQSIGLTGTGASAAATLSPTSLSFGNEVFSTPSAAKNITLTSTGTGNLIMSSPSVTFTGTNAADFAPTNHCPASLAPGAKCTISVTFTPSIVGAESATLNVNDNAANTPQKVTLSGTGLAPATLTPPSVGFGGVAINTGSSGGKFTLQNNELTALSILSIGFTGHNAGDFSQTNTCGTLPASLAAGASCTINVTLTPSALGPESATLNVSDNAAAPYNTVTASLSGAVVAPATLTPGSVSIGNVPVKTASSAASFTLFNNEEGALSISKITFTGTNASDFSQTGGTCGSSLSGRASCTISVTFTPSATGAESATLTVSDGAAAPYNTATAALSGTGVADVTLTPASYSFGDVAVKTASNAKSFTLHNYESTALSISNIGFTGANAGDFSQTGGTCGTPPTILAAASSCTINVTFTPSTTAAESATLTVSDNAAAAQYQTLTSALGGTGVADVTLTPASYGFGNVAVRTASSAKSFTLQNNELTALKISSIGFTGTNFGDFAQTNTCVLTTNPGLGLAAGASCTISVTFTPSATAAESATLTVNDNASAPYNTVTSALSGTGVADVTLMPASYSFGNVAVKTASAAKSFTLQNNELTALKISSIGFTGTNFGDFALSPASTCGTSLAAQTSCTISVTFTPSVLAAETATLTVNDSASAPYNTLTSALSGTGVAQATVSPTSLTFSKQTVGTTSAAQTVTLRNNLLTTLTVSSLTFTGADSGDFAQTNTCGGGLGGGGLGGGGVAAQSTCTISVTFKPTAKGTRTATLNVNDSANNTPQTVSLTGTGQ